MSRVHIPQHGYDLIQYIYVFELDGIKHVGGARGIPDNETVMNHLKMQHPRMKILWLDRLKNPEQYSQIAQELANDPNWAAMNQQEFNASAQAAHEEIANSGGGVPLDHPAQTNPPGTTEPARKIIIPEATA